MEIVAENADGNAHETRPNVTMVDEELSLTRDVDSKTEVCDCSEHFSDPVDKGNNAHSKL
jgi:hypothetical protein